MDSVCLTCEREIFTYWKLFLTEQYDCEPAQKALTEICSRFQGKLFSISRGNTEQISKDCEEVQSSIQLFLPNFDKKSFPLLENALEIFNSFHQEVMELQVAKARNLITDLKESYKFTEYHERILMPNLRYNEQEIDFLNYVFNLKEFRSELVRKKFLDKLIYFMMNSSDKTKEEVDYKCCKLEEEFIYEVGIMVALNKRKVEDLFRNLGNRIFCVVALRNIQVYPEDSNADWSTLYSGLYELEDCRLTQIVTVGVSFYIASVVLLKSQKTALILITPEGSFALKDLIADPDVVIVTGSSIENFIMIYNSLQVFVQGFIVKNTEFHETKRFPILQPRVLSAGYLKKANEILYISESRVVCYHSFTSKSRTISHLENHNYNKIESNGEFLFFYKEDETTLVDHSLARIYTEARQYSHCFLSGQTLILSNFDGRNDLVSIKIEIADECFVAGSAVKDLLFKAKYEVKANFQHGLNLLGGLLRTNKYQVESVSLEGEKEEVKDGRTIN